MMEFGKTCRWILSALTLLIISHLSYAQEIDEQELLSRMHRDISNLVNSGKADTVKKLGFAGKDLALKLGNQNELAYFNYMLGAIYRYESPIVSKQYLDTALSISKKVDYKVGEMLAYSSLSKLMVNRGQYDSALLYEHRSTEILNSFPDSEKKFRELVKSHNSLGVIYRNKTDFVKSMKAFTDAYALALKYGHINLANYAKLNIASTNRSMGRFEEAKIHYGKVVAYSDSVDNAQLKTWSFLGLAELSAMDLDYNKSLDYYRQAIKISKRDKNTSLREISLQIGNVFTKLGQLDSANFYIDLAETLVVEDKNDAYYIELRIARSYVDMANENLSAAQKKLEEALVKTQEKVLPNQEAVILELLSDLYAQKEDFRTSYKYFKAFKVLDDSIFSSKNLHSINSIQYQFDTEIKNQKITNLEQLANNQTIQIRSKNKLILISVIAFALLISLIYVIYKQKVDHAKSNELLAKLKLSNAQLSPHFLFNSLSAIQQLVLENHKPLETADYLSKFSRLTRKMLEFTELESISLEDELTFLENYLSLQKLRFGERFEFEINTPKDLFTSNFYIPPLITQPFVENSLEHGFRGSKDNNKITINIIETQRGIQLVIEDNGVGIDSTLHLKSELKESKALSLTKGRIKFWERKTGMTTSMDISDLSNIIPGAHGTRITLTFPGL
ncbi:hypothetical protein BFP97_06960 [Roseivirga sp. 4D4]|uniref:histidine kinase n=1 Tax=Roseivirga sp. 4D4 TaxID=1889784 RepID=UPI0008531C2C|nr:histidine kinase [Roseivirga sp. 4D4]OEK01266.1 hypothetical protein BFP97_06960 [Roseivirga sp. 4D4]